MTKTYPIIPLNGFLHAVDKETESAKFVYLPTLHRIEKYKSDKETAKEIDEMIEAGERPTYRTIEAWAVVASNDPSLTDVPKLPEIEDTILKTTREVIGSDKRFTTDDLDKIMLGYQLGYKAASKKKYTEEQVKNLYLGTLQNIGTSVKQEQMPTWEQAKAMLERQAIPKEVELEMDMKWDYSGAPPACSYFIPKVENGFVIIKSWKYE